MFVQSLTAPIPIENFSGAMFPPEFKQQTMEPIPEDTPTLSQFEASRQVNTTPVQIKIEPSAALFPWKSYRREYSPKRKCSLWGVRPTNDHQFPKPQ